MSEIDFKKLEGIKDHYVNKVFEELKEENGTLSNAQKYKFSVRLVGCFLDNYLRSPKKSTIYCYLNNLIQRNLVMYQDEERLFLHYVKYVGVEDEIVRYFVNEYEYLLEPYRNKRCYFYLKEQYPSIILEFLNNKPYYKHTIESLISKNITKKYYSIRINNKPAIEDIRAAKKEQLLEIRENYAYVKTIVFKNYKGLFKEDELKKEVDEMFETYFNAYVNGVSSSPITKYLFTRLNHYFDKLLLEQENPSYQVRQYLINRFIKSANYVIKSLGIMVNDLLAHEVNDWVNYYVESGLYKREKVRDFLLDKLCSYEDMNKEDYQKVAFEKQTEALKKSLKKSYA